MLAPLLTGSPVQKFHGYIDSGFSAVDPSGRVWAMGIDFYDDSDGFSSTLYAAISGDEARLMDFSRFTAYSTKHFKMMVEMGFPLPSDFGVSGDWRPADIERVYAEQVSA